jgi:hypothetical protein
VTSRDWEKELAAIDRQLASVPDEALLPKPQPAPAQAAPARPAVPAPGPTIVERPKRQWTVVLLLLTLVLVGAAGVAALVYWPYVATCGLPLAGYLAAVAGVGFIGLWISIRSWRHRSALFHVLGLALMVASGVFAAREVLPRVGYAMPTMEHPAMWACP